MVGQKGDKMEIFKERVNNMELRKGTPLQKKITDGSYIIKLKWVIIYRESSSDKHGVRDDLKKTSTVYCTLL